MKKKNTVKMEHRGKREEKDGFKGREDFCADTY